MIFPNKMNINTLVNKQSLIECVCFGFTHRVELLPYDLISQLFRILTIETKQEKGECFA